MEGYIQIGKIVATSGLSGQLVLKHGLGKKTDFKIKAIFLENNLHEFLPYFIQHAKAKSMAESIIQLEGIVSREEALKLIKRPVWVTEKDFTLLVSKSSPLAMLHFQLFNFEKLIGKIKEVIEQPHQVLVVIERDGKDVLIPLHDQTLKSIDHENKKVYTELPDGLLEIYQ